MGWYYPMYYNKWYMIGTIFVLIGAVIMMFAQAKVSSNYAKYSKIPSNCGITGAMIARQILDRNGLQHITVHSVKGKLSDHYDPRKKIVNLSQDIYSGTSIASLAVAAHECGHAIQHSESYKPLLFRNTILPLCNVGQTLGWIAVVIGLVIGHTDVAIIGVILMSGILIFQLVTLPVELDASSRALTILGDSYLSVEEFGGAKKMLSAAAFTYIASVLTTLLSLLRVVLMIVGNSRD